MLHCALTLRPIHARGILLLKRKVASSIANFVSNSIVKVAKLLVAGAELKLALIVKCMQRVMWPQLLIMQSKKAMRILYAAKTVWFVVTNARFPILKPTLCINVENAKIPSALTALRIAMTAREENIAVPV